jgi:transcriptional regulator with XRE-family HTH domain
VEAITCEVVVTHPVDRYRDRMVAVPVGELVRDWRQRRRRSQMHLALEVGVSARHLSFVETGRSKPSPELVESIAEELEVPLRERNTLLLAAGYAPRYRERTLDDPAMRFAVESVQRMLDAHDPYPGVLIDRQWNIVRANAAASALTVGLPPEVLGPPINVYRVCLHPDGLAARTINFPEWATYLVGQLERSLAFTGDPALQALRDEVRAYPDVAAALESVSGAALDDVPLLVPLRLQAGDGELSLFTTLTTFGTPRDVTLDELAVELFYPADEATEAALRGVRSA